MPEWPDPRADGTFPQQNNPVATEGKSPRIVTAVQACRRYWSGSIRFTP